MVTNASTTFALSTTFTIFKIYLKIYSGYCIVYLHKRGRCERGTLSLHMGRLKVPLELEVLVAPLVSRTFGDWDRIHNVCLVCHQSRRKRRISNFRIHCKLTIALPLQRSNFIIGATRNILCFVLEILIFRTHSHKLA